MGKLVFIYCLPETCQALPIANYHESHENTCCLVQISQVLRGIISCAGPPPRCPMSFYISGFKSFTPFLPSLLHKSYTSLQPEFRPPSPPPGLLQPFPSSSPDPPTVCFSLHSFLQKHYLGSGHFPWRPVSNQSTSQSSLQSS